IQPRDCTTEAQKKLFPRWFEFEKGAPTAEKKAGAEPAADDAAYGTTDF
ncbi:hypothetical protein LCGC14_1281670, partial [marine sediment metagenome]